MPVSAEIFWREQIVLAGRNSLHLFRPSIGIGCGGDERVGFPARLGTHTAVPAPSPDNRREKTLPGIPVAECPVCKDFEPDTGIFCIVRDPLHFSKREFAGEDNS